MGIWDVLTRFILPPVLGGAGGWLAAWLNWDLEKRRERRRRRIELVDLWRTNLLPELVGDGDYGLGYGGHALTQHPDYPSIRPHLSAEFLSKIEQRGERMIVTAGTPFLRKGLMAEIGRIEGEWGLI